MRRFSLMGLFAILALAPNILTAQSVPSSYEYIETRFSAGVFGGYLNIDDGDREFGPEPAAIFGPRFEIRLAGPLLGSVEVGLAPTTRSVFTAPVNATDPQPTILSEDDVFLMTVEAGLLLQLTGARTWNGFAPIVGIAGGGLFDLTPGSDDEEAIDANQRYRIGPAFAARASVGTDYFLTERLSIRAEFRDHLWRLQDPPGLTGLTDSDTEWTHNLGFVLGGALHF